MDILIYDKSGGTQNLLNYFKRYEALSEDAHVMEILFLQDFINEDLSFSKGEKVLLIDDDNIKESTRNEVFGLKKDCVPTTTDFLALKNSVVYPFEKIKESINISNVSFSNVDITSPKKIKSCLDSNYTLFDSFNLLDFLLKNSKYKYDDFAKEINTINYNLKNGYIEKYDKFLNYIKSPEKNTYKELINKYSTNTSKKSEANSFREEAKALHEKAASEGIILSFSKEEVEEKKLVTSDGKYDWKKVCVLLKNKYEIKKKDLEKEKSDSQELKQINWKNPLSAATYENMKYYEKNVPFVLQQKKIFLLWKTVWKETGKIEKDENGNEHLKPLRDSDSNIIYDSSGKEIPDGRMAKVPWSALTGRETDPTNPNNYVDFKTACEAVNEFKADGIGIALGNGLVGIDIDHVRDEKGELTPEAKDVLSICNSYSEFSPSGTGIHILLYGDLPPGRRRNGNFEMYSEKRYFTLSGDVVPGFPVRMIKKEEGTKAIEQVYNTYMKRQDDEVINETHIDQMQLPLEFDIENEFELSDEQIINICRSSGERNKARFGGLNKFEELYYKGNWEPFFPAEAKAGNGQSPADLSLCQTFSFYTTSPGQVDRLFRSSALMRNKWDQLRGKETYGVTTIKTAFKMQKNKYSFKKTTKENYINKGE